MSVSNTLDRMLHFLALGILQCEAHHSILWTMMIGTCLHLIFTSQPAHNNSNSHSYMVLWIWLTDENCFPCLLKCWSVRCPWMCSTVALAKGSNWGLMNVNPPQSKCCRWPGRMLFIVWGSTTSLTFFLSSSHCAASISLWIAYPNGRKHVFSSTTLLW